MAHSNRSREYHAVCENRNGSQAQISEPGSVVAPTTAQVEQAALRVAE